MMGMEMTTQQEQFMRALSSPPPQAARTSFDGLHHHHHQQQHFAPASPAAAVGGMGETSPPRHVFWDNGVMVAEGPGGAEEDEVPAFRQRHQHLRTLHTGLDDSDDEDALAMQEMEEDAKIHGVAPQTATRALKAHFPGSPGGAGSTTAHAAGPQSPGANNDYNRGGSMMMGRGGENHLPNHHDAVKDAARLAQSEVIQDATLFAHGPLRRDRDGPSALASLDLSAVKDEMRKNEGSLLPGGGAALGRQGALAAAGLFPHGMAGPAFAGMGQHAAPYPPSPRAPLGPLDQSRPGTRGRVARRGSPGIAAHYMPPSTAPGPWRPNTSGGGAPAPISARGNPRFLEKALGLDAGSLFPPGEKGPPPLNSARRSGEGPRGRPGQHRGRGQPPHSHTKQNSSNRTTDLDFAGERMTTLPAVKVAPRDLRSLYN